MAKKVEGNFPEDVLRVIRMMSLDSGLPVIAGSQSYRDALYAADYDCYQVIKMRYASKQKALRVIAKRIKEAVRHLLLAKNVFIGNIKLGSVPEWKVIPDEATVKGMKVVGYDAEESRKKVLELAEAGIIDSEEKQEALRLLKPSLSPMELMEAKEELRFHVVRWEPRDVLKGYCILRDNRQFTLEDGFSSPGMSKLDVIALVNNKYADISCIYEIRNKGTILNPLTQPSIKVDILELFLQGNYFKMMKRILSLARNGRSASIVDTLVPILNSDAGILYSIISDLGTILYMAENYKAIPEARIDYELDAMRYRLGNVSIPSYLKKEPAILKKIMSITKAKIKKPSTQRAIEKLSDELSKIMNASAKKQLQEAGFLPLSSRWLP